MREQGGWRAPLFVAAMLVSLGCFRAVADVEQVKTSSVAGVWYPDDESWLSSNIDRLLAEAKPEPRLTGGGLRALIVPHAGYQYSGAVAAMGFKLVEGRSYQRVLVIGPAHDGGFRGLWLPEETHFSTPLGKIPVDRDAVQSLRGLPLVRVQEVGLREHSIEMELPFLQRGLAPDWKLLPVFVGWMQDDDYPVLADALRGLIDDETLVVVSSDFTHYGARYGYLPFPPGPDVSSELRALDMGAFQQIASLDPDGFARYRAETGITVCGFAPVGLLLRILSPGTRVELVRYTTSGELTGEYLNSVSYMAVAFYNPPKLAETFSATDERPDTREAQLAAQPMPADQDLHRLHRLAQLAVIASVRRDEQAKQALLNETAELPETLTHPSGAFVTLRRGGELRGCVGYMEPMEPLYRAVIQNGINAALHDKRFPPVQPAELASLDLEVNVLTDPRPVASYTDYQVDHQGIILRKEGHSAVFLPEVASQLGWDREQTLTQLAQKAGLAPDAWREGASFEVFTTQSYRAPVVGAPP